MGNGTRRDRQQLTYRTTVAAEPMSAAQWQAVRRMLARAIAQAYVADHPEEFVPRERGGASVQISGSLPAARADAAAPAARGSDPDHWSMEHVDADAQPGARRTTDAGTTTP